MDCIDDKVHTAAIGWSLLIQMMEQCWAQEDDARPSFSAVHGDALVLYKEQRDQVRFREIMSIFCLALASCALAGVGTQDRGCLNVVHSAIPSVLFHCFRR